MLNIRQDGHAINQKVKNAKLSSNRARAGRNHLDVFSAQGKIRINVRNVYNVLLRSNTLLTLLASSNQIHVDNKREYAHEAPRTAPKCSTRQLTRSRFLSLSLSLFCLYIHSPSLLTQYIPGIIRFKEPRVRACTYARICRCTQLPDAAGVVPDVG